MKISGRREQLPELGYLFAKMWCCKVSALSEIQVTCFLTFESGKLTKHFASMSDIVSNSNHFKDGISDFPFGLVSTITTLSEKRTRVIHMKIPFLHSDTCRLKSDGKNQSHTKNYRIHFLTWSFIPGLQGNSNDPLFPLVG